MGTVMISKYRHSLCWLLLLLLTVTGWAQSNVINSGSSISIASGVNVSVAGNLTNGVGGLFDNAGTLSIDGDFTNNGGNPGFTVGTGTVDLSGAVAQTIGGNSITGFNILNFSGAGNKLLAADTNVTDSLNLTSASLILQSNTVSIQSADTAAITTNGGLIVSETSDAAGIVSWAIGTATGIFNLPFGTSAGTPVPVVANINAPGIGAGSLNFATYPTATNNLPLPPGATDLDILDAVSDDADVAVNRFWLANSAGFGTPPAYTLTLTPDPLNDLAFSEGNLDGNLTGVQFAAGDWLDGNGGAVPAGSSADVVITAAGIIPLAITGINDQPSFVLNAEEGVFVGDSTEAQTLPGFAIDIDLGAVDDIEQQANFLVVVDNPALFAVQPSINSAGTLDFVANSDAAGSNPVEVTVTLTDGGGTEFGGVDSSDEQTFFILFDVIEVPTLSPVGLGILLLLVLALTVVTSTGRFKAQHN